MNLHVLKEITEQKSLKNRFRKKTNEIDTIKIRKKTKTRGAGVFDPHRGFPLFKLVYMYIGAETRERTSC